MKLKNKKTGEIKEVIVGGYPVSGKTKMWECSEMDANEESGYKLLGRYTTLAELNEEWEDYEEPKERWYINENGGVMKYVPSDPDGEDLAYMKYQDEIGNYFETKEEAEKAVEKLKAWKRLKEAGFVFCGTDCINQNNVIYFEFGKNPLTQAEADEAERDLEICFGGEE